MQGHVYHWKHGWIPLSHFAALQKAHGSHKGAAKYLNESNGHHGSASHTLSHGASETHGGFAKGAHVAYNGRASDGTGTVEGSRKLNGETILQVRDHKDGKVYEWAPEHVAAHSGSSKKPDAAPKVPTETAKPAVKSVSSMTDAEKIKAAEIMHGSGSKQHIEAARRFGSNSDHLQAQAAAKHAEAQRAFSGTGWNDRAAGRLDAKGMKQFYRGTDGALKRYTEAERQAKGLESKAALARAREDEAARVRLTHDDIKGATHVQDSNGWHEVVRVNAKSVTVKTPYSWTDTIPHEKIHKVHKKG